MKLNQIVRQLERTNVGARLIAPVPVASLLARWMELAGSSLRCGLRARSIAPLRDLWPDYLVKYQYRPVPLADQSALRSLKRHLQEFRGRIIWPNFIILILVGCILFASCGSASSQRVTQSNTNRSFHAALLQGSHLGDWPVFGYDPGHTGYVDAAVQPRAVRGRLVWSRTFGSLFSSPVAGLGLVFIASTDGNLYALKQESGAVVWSVHINSYLTDATPALEGQVLFVAEEGSKLAALNALTGQRYWLFNTFEKIQAAPLVVGTRVLVASRTTLWTLDATSGRLLWKFHYGASEWPTTASPTVAGTTVYVAPGSATKLWALSLLDGHVLWSFDTGDWITSAALVNAGMVYVATWHGYLFALDRTTGMRAWSYALNGVQAGRQRSVVDGVGGNMALANGHLYLGDYRGAILCLDTQHGTLNWRYVTGAQVLATPIVVADHVYIGSDDGYFYALDMRTGRPTWRYITGEVRSSASLADGLLYVGSLSGTIYAFN